MADGKAPNNIPSVEQISKDLLSIKSPKLNAEQIINHTAICFKMERLS